MTPPVPVELLKLRSATAAYVAILADVKQWAEQARGVNRTVNREFAEQLAWLLDELRDATLPHESGTPAAIARVVGEILGETET